jgi:hypothetical protein
VTPDLVYSLLLFSAWFLVGYLGSQLYIRRRAERQADEVRRFRERASGELGDAPDELAPCCLLDGQKPCAGWSCPPMAPCNPARCVGASIHQRWAREPKLPPKSAA